jgi:hypothetical protein
VNKHFKSARNGQFRRSFTGLHNKRAMNALSARPINKDFYNRGGVASEGGARVLITS